jgi:putative polymerase
LTIQAQPGEMTREPSMRKVPMPSDLASLNVSAPPLQSVTVRAVGPVLVMIAVTFNAFLCLVTTVAGIHFSAATIVVCELVILAIGFYSVRARITAPAMRIILALTALLLGMKLVNPGLDLKILHDLAIDYVFYLLGTMVTLQQATRMVWIVTIGVLAVSSIEVLLPDFYNSIFNVWGYYVDKGVLTNAINYGNTTTFISGIRGGVEARTFFPALLGQSRFSSVFLEPVSMGNFAVIIFAWCLSVRMRTARLTALLIFLAAVCAILSDSRFAFVCWFLMILLRISPLHRSKLMIFCIPLFAMMAIVLYALVEPPVFGRPFILSDDFPGRLLFSGRLLDFWGWKQWFALAPSPIYVSDTGYAYAINALGLPIALFMLALFAMQPAKTNEAASMKAMLTVYMATSLCIGANMFTIKTAALVWLMYGATNGLPAMMSAVARPGRRAVRYPVPAERALSGQSIV